jgi:hypothetical protein
MANSEKLWGGRFTEKPHETFAEFNDSFRFDRRLFAADVRGSMAHAKGLERAGLISADELDAIVGGLSQLQADAADPRSAGRDLRYRRRLSRCRHPGLYASPAGTAGVVRTLVFGVFRDAAAR